MTAERPIDVWRRAAASGLRSVRASATSHAAHWIPRPLFRQQSVWWRRVVPVALLLVLLGADALLRPATPIVLRALLDEAAHLATSLLCLMGLSMAGVRLTRRVVLSAAAAAVLIDLDHLPSILTGTWYLAGDRPVTHSLWLIPVAAGVGWLAHRRFGPPAQQLGTGIALGIGFHLFRDVAGGSGVPLLRPVSAVAVQLPHAAYLSVLVVIAVAATILPDRWSQPRQAAGLTPQASSVMVLGATLIYAVTVTQGMWQRLETFRLAGFDTGIFAQGIWLLSQGRDPFVTVRGLDLFGDHASFILLALAPLYAQTPDPRLLLALQAFAVAAPALVLNRLVLRTGGADQAWAAVVVPLVYLLYPAQQWGGTFEWHPESLAPAPLLLGAVWGLYSARRLWWWPLGVAVLCKEDVSLVVIGVGLFLLSYGRVRRGLATMAAGLGYFLVVTTMVMPLLGAGRGSIYYAKNYGIDTDGRPLGWVAWLPTIVGQTFQHAGSDEGLVYLALILLPVTGLALLAPRWLLPIAGPLVLNLAAVLPQLHSIRYHYLLTSAPFVVAAAYAGYRWLSGALQRTEWSSPADVRDTEWTAPAGWLRFDRPAVRWPAVLLLTMLGTALVFSANRGALPQLDREGRATPTATVTAGHRALDLIPAGAAVAASWNLVPLLSDRVQIYELPVPLEKGWWGTGDPTEQMRADVDYVIVQPSRLRPMDEAAWRRYRSASGWQVLVDSDDIVLLKRAG